MNSETMQNETAKKCDCKISLLIGAAFPLAITLLCTIVLAIIFLIESSMTTGRMEFGSIAVILGVIALPTLLILNFVSHLIGFFTALFAEKLLNCESICKVELIVNASLILPYLAGILYVIVNIKWENLNK